MPRTFHRPPPLFCIGNRKRFSQVPAVFHSGTATVIMASLSGGGLVSYRTIFRALKATNPHYNALRALEDFQLVTFSDCREVISLNSAHPLYPELLRLARAITKSFKLQALKPFASPLGCYDRAGTIDLPLMGSTNRAELLALAHLSGGIDTVFAASVLGHQRNALQFWVMRLVRDGILERHAIHGRYALSIARDLCYREELGDLLTRWDFLSGGNFSSLARLARERRVTPKDMSAMVRRVGAQ